MEQRQSFEQKLSFIGSFDISSGIIDIADPYINSVSVAVEKIPVANEKMVKVRGALNGVYNTYHVVDEETGYYNSLLAIHCTYDAENYMEKGRNIDLGLVSSSLSGAVVLVDERYRNDTEYCYYSIEQDAYYNPEMIIDKLNDMPYSEELKKSLEELSKEHIKYGTYPKGEDILEIIQGEVAWKGFAAFGTRTSHWSAEVINKVRNNHIYGTAIKGGVASAIQSIKGGYHSCSCFRNNRGDAYAVKVNLIPQDENYQ